MSIIRNDTLLYIMILEEVIPHYDNIVKKGWLLY